MTTTIPHNALRMVLQRIASREAYQGPVITPQDIRRGAEAVLLLEPQPAFPPDCAQINAVGFASRLLAGC